MARQLVCDFLQHRHESEIGHHHAIAGMIDDPDDLLGKQAGIDGVIDRADAENAVPAFQMPPGIPPQRRNAIAELDAVAIEPLRHAQGARADLGVIGGVDRPFDRARDDRAFGVIGRGVINDAMA